MTIQVWELERKSTGSRDGAEVVRKFRVIPYSAHVQFEAFMLGNIQYLNGKFVRTLPKADSLRPHCYADRVETVGVGVFAGNEDDGPNTTSRDMQTILEAANNYQEAECTVYFKSNTFTREQWDSNNEGILLGLEFDFTGQSLTLPNEWFSWVNSSTINIGQSGTNASKTISQIKTQVVRYYCINRPINAITKLAGKINATDILWQDIVFPAETLLFDSAHIREKTTYNNVKFYEITYRFIVQPTYELVATSSETVNSSGVITSAASTAYAYVGHNRLYRPDRGYWDYVQSTTGSRRPYLLDSTVSQTINGVTVTGFNLLTDPGAN